MAEKLLAMPTIDRKIGSDIRRADELGPQIARLRSEQLHSWSRQPVRSPELLLSPGRDPIEPNDDEHRIIELVTSLGEKDVRNRDLEGGV